MPICRRRGCGKDLDEQSDEKCIYHPGAPVFHEGLKSWSCCADVNKPVLDFDEFIKIPGCTEAESHSADAPEAEPKPEPVSTVDTLTMSESTSGTETYTSRPIGAVVSDVAAAVVPAPAPLLEEEDDPNVLVEPGTRCKRNGCGVTFVSDEVSRHGDGSVCVYHPAPPIFREGSKGYLCCKRRVLEFEEFLKIPGCKTGKHVFSPLRQDKPVAAEEKVECRIDHYQTLDKVHVSIFAKQADRKRSSIKFDETQIGIDIHLPNSRRFTRTLELFGPITPAESTVQFFGTKVELHLQKKDSRSWTILEKPTRDLGNISLTFGVGGRTGTIGGKDLVLDHVNQSARA